MKPAATLRPDADEAFAQPWLYRSEAFAEDLSELNDDWPAVEDAQDESKSLPARLTWPLSALVLGIGLVVGFGF
jgi:hypothetical protein